MQITHRLVSDYGDTQFRITFNNMKETFKLLVASDIHLDNPLCDTKLFKSHLERAKESNTYIIILGDLIDAMQHHADKRHNKRELTPDFVGNRNSYLNLLVDKVVQFLEPYKDNILMLAYGNHEWTHIKHGEVDLLRLIANRLGCIIGGYEGYITLNFTLYNNNGSKIAKRIYYQHGTGGNAPMTMGILNHKRSDIWVRGADIIISGHRHKTFFYEEVVMDMSTANKRVYKSILHLQLPTYLTRGDGASFSAMKSFPPPSLGSYLIEFVPYRDQSQKKSAYEIKINFTKWQ